MKSNINLYPIYFTSIKDIPYSDSNVFIYTQDKMKLIKCITPYVSISVFLLIIKMLQINIICSDIAINNLGIQKETENILLFDLQGLCKYENTDFCRLIRNINKYLNATVLDYKVFDENNNKYYGIDKITKKCTKYIILLYNYYIKTFTEKQLYNIICKCKDLNINLNSELYIHKLYKLFERLKDKESIKKDRESKYIKKDRESKYIKKR